LSLTLPNPGQPAFNSALASGPVLANINAIAQAIQAFDGSQIVSGSVVAAALAANINPNTLLHDTISPFVQSGCIWAAVSGLAGTMTGGIIYVGPSGSILRVVVNGVGSHTFTASQDTYIDIDYNGNITYSGVANGASSPNLTANSIRVAKIITSGSAITNVLQGAWNGTVITSTSFGYCGFDSLGNSIYNVDPSATAVGRVTRVATVSTGNPGGSPVGYNGFPTIAANLAINTNYKIIMTDYNLAFVGGSGLAVGIVTPQIGSTAITQGYEISATVGAGISVNSIWQFNSGSTSGLTTINFLLSTGGGTWTSLSLVASATQPATLSIEKV
jgi:hypothetical protein